MVGSVPIFNMQIERLPGWVLKELDKSTRRCVWGNVEGKRGIHLLDWRTLCRPKELGDADLKSTVDMNQKLVRSLLGGC